MFTPRLMLWSCVTVPGDAVDHSNVETFGTDFDVEQAVPLATLAKLTEVQLDIED